MGGSRRKYKRSRTNKVRVGLPKKNPNVFKPAFSIPPKFRSIMDLSKTKWDDQGSVLENYKSFGVVSNPNLLGVRARTSKIIESESLQLPLKTDGVIDEFEHDGSGSELEEDDVKTALGKQRVDGKSGSLQPLTTMQRVYIRTLVEKYGDDYKRMFMDIKLNKLQHSIATLEKLCKRYKMYKDKNPMLVPF
uniref:uncharacterized protein LOC122593756 n=1 Tax=Erigeron canadensis TaxID=72917 RepID=UPI001CB8B690|nr:uncharacterized protein LOC122593756 [Erigeron canadensis]